MSVFSYEWKKLMLYQRGLCYILAALLVSTVWLAAADRPQNSAMEEYRGEYEWYLERLEGAYTEEKAAWLEQEAQAITEARSTRAQSQESYYSGRITAEQYERQIAEVNTVLAHEHGFEAVYQQYLYICENTGNRYFLNTNGWAGLFSAQTLDFPLFLVILILAAAAFCSEYSCQMDALLRTAPQSRKSARSKAVVTLCAVFVLCGGLALIRFVFFGMKYGLPHGEYPVQSIAGFGSGTKNISLLAAYLILTVLRCFGSVYLAVPALYLCFGEEIRFDGGNWSGVHLDTLHRPVPADLLPLADTPAVPAGSRFSGGGFLRGGFVDGGTHRDFFRAFPPGAAGPARPVCCVLHPHGMVGTAAKHKLLAVRKKIRQTAWGYSVGTSDFALAVRLLCRRICKRDIQFLFAKRVGNLQRDLR